MSESKAVEVSDWSDGVLVRKDYDETATNAFNEGDFQAVQLRSTTYLTDKVKIPSQSPAFRNCGVNVYKTTDPLYNAVANVPSLRQFIDDHATEHSFFLVVNWQLPGPPYHSVVHLFARTLPEGEDPAFDLMFKRFLEGSHDFKKSRFKFICRLVKAGWVVSTCVSQMGGERPAIIGNKLITKHFQGSNYIEIDINVGSSRVASALQGVILSGTKKMVVDLAFLMESQQVDELPERLCGITRFVNCDLGAVAVELELPADYDPNGQGAVQ